MEIGTQHQTPLEVLRELERLEREVIDAAKADYLCARRGDGSNTDIDAIIKTRNELNAATSALIEFEFLTPLLKPKGVNR